MIDSNLNFLISILLHGCCKELHASENIKGGIRRHAFTIIYILHNGNNLNTFSIRCMHIELAILSL